MLATEPAELVPVALDDTLIARVRAMLTDARREPSALPTPCIVPATKPGGTGYSLLKVRGKQWKGHIAAYATYVGPVPAGHDVAHLCHNRRCVNPLHLAVQTPRDNRGRGRAAVGRGKSHAPLQVAYNLAPVFSAVATVLASMAQQQEDAALPPGFVCVPDDPDLKAALELIDGKAWGDVVITRCGPYARVLDRRTDATGAAAVGKVEVDTHYVPIEHHLYVVERRRPVGAHVYRVPLLTDAERLLSAHQRNALMRQRVPACWQDRGSWRLLPGVESRTCYRRCDLERLAQDVWRLPDPLRLVSCCDDWWTRDVPSRVDEDLLEGEDVDAAWVILREASAALSAPPHTDRTATRQLSPDSPPSLASSASENGAPGHHTPA